MSGLVTLRQRLPVVGVVTVYGLLLLAPLVLGGESFEVFWLRRVLILTVAAIGLNIVSGLAGPISMGHVAIFACGAYGTGFVATRISGAGGFWLGMLVSCALAGLVGLLVGFPSLRLHHWYFAVVTLGLALVTPQLLIEWEGLTNGYTGLSGIPRSNPFGSELGETGMYYVVWAAVTLSVVAFAIIKRSSLGRRMQMVKTDEVMAQSLGVSAHRTLLWGFVLSAIPTGIAGALHAHELRYIHPDMFGLDISLLLILALVIGGLGTTAGPLVGMFAILLLQERVTWLEDYKLLVYGSLILFVVHLLPNGFVAAVDRLGVRLFGSRPEPAVKVRNADSAVDTRSVGRHGGGASLVVEGISKSFGGNQAVQDVDIEIRPGIVHALIGPNGAGKTTVVNLITGFYAVDTGTVLLGGELVTGRTADELARSGLRRTFQHPRLISDWTLARNIAAGSRNVDLGPQSVHLIDVAGLTPLLQEHADRLTHGHRRLAEIVRAVNSDPPPAIVLLDEPAAGLNEEEVGQLSRVVRALADDGFGVLLVEHNMAFVMAVADEVTVLDQGRVLASGAPDEIRANQDVRAAYLGHAAPVSDGGR